MTMLKHQTESEHIIKQHINGSILDVDWQTNRTFASGSIDMMIYVCKIGENHSVRIFPGHK
ncbi:putative transcription factor WD40-like family [Helianthus annuus]|nr:putative transcription factor WD40-like family [Helianthus annuus]